ncbi:hypothetical protein [Nisaea sediminum]|uniref:hypothetical protein n=1 Tax=Nisaea sediminum TaxID=2775867 RepID=UPI0018666785|nr:hypothetical protein [Nisaea sediminum]
MASGGTPGKSSELSPYSSQFAIAVDSYNRNSNGFHPKSAQDKINDAIAGLRRQIAGADALYDEALVQQAKRGTVDTRALNSRLQALSLGFDGFDDTLAAAVIADQNKIRATGPLDQDSARVLARRQQATDATLSDSIASVLTVIGSDFNAMIAPPDSFETEVSRITESEAAGNADFPATVKSASLKATQSGLAAVAANPGAYPKLK